MTTGRINQVAPRARGPPGAAPSLRSAPAAEGGPALAGGPRRTRPAPSVAPARRCPSTDSLASSPSRSGASAPAGPAGSVARRSASAPAGRRGPLPGLGPPQRAASAGGCGRAAPALSPPPLVSIGRARAAPRPRVPPPVSLAPAGAGWGPPLRAGRPRCAAASRSRAGSGCSVRWGPAWDRRERARAAAAAAPPRRSGGGGGRARGAGLAGRPPARVFLTAVGFRGPAGGSGRLPSALALPSDVPDRSECSPRPGGAGCAQLCGSRSGNVGAAAAACRLPGPPPLPAGRTAPPAPGTPWVATGGASCPGRRDARSVGISQVNRYGPPLDRPGPGPTARRFWFSRFQRACLSGTGAHAAAPVPSPGASACSDRAPPLSAGLSPPAFRPPPAGLPLRDRGPRGRAGPRRPAGSVGISAVNRPPAGGEDGPGRGPGRPPARLAVPGPGAFLLFFFVPDPRPIGPAERGYPPPLYRVSQGR